MGLDARVRYTKMVIQESFIHLVQEKPFHAIKLTEVCEKAGINRTTFYKYYQDVYDWKEKLEQQCISRTDEILQQCNESNIQDILCLQFREMKENAELYALIASPNFESDVLDLCIAMSMEKMDTETKKYFTVKDGMDYQRRWDCCFGIYGCRGVVECWIRDGMKESPEQLADYYLARIRNLVNQS